MYIKKVRLEGFYNCVIAVNPYTGRREWRSSYSNVKERQNNKEWIQWSADATLWINLSKKQTRSNLQAFRRFCRKGRLHEIPREHITQAHIL